MALELSAFLFCRFFSRFFDPITTARNFQRPSVNDRFCDLSARTLINKGDRRPCDFHSFTAFSLGIPAAIDQSDAFKLIKSQYDRRAFLPVRFRKRTDSSGFNRSSHNPPNYLYLHRVQALSFYNIPGVSRLLFIELPGSYVLNILIYIRNFVNPL